MRIDKSKLFESAIALNGDDKKYEIIIDGDKIITRVKWMNAVFFSPDSVTDEMKEFEYIVKVNDNGTYSELDKSVSTSTSAKRGGLTYQENIFVGKQLTFNKTIGLGKNKESGESGLIDITFYSEEYKNPVRTLLKNSGYKKKMGTLGKIFIGAAIFAIIVIIAVALLLSHFNNKTAITVSEFESVSKAFGYQVAVDEKLENAYDYVQSVRIALDTNDNYQIDLYVLSGSNYAKNIYENNKIGFEKIVSEESAGSSYVNSSKYNKYSASTNTSYLYVARIDNTVLYIDVDIDHKAEVEKFINEIGY